MHFASVKALVSALPEVELSSFNGTPALRVHGKLMARLRRDGVTLVLRVQKEERERLLSECPEVYFLTDRYRDHPWVLARLSAIKPAQLRASLAHAREQSAPTPFKAVTSTR